MSDTIYKKAKSVIEKSLKREDILKAYLKENFENYGGDQYVGGSQNSSLVYYLADMKTLLQFLVLFNEDEEALLVENSLRQFINAYIYPNLKKDFIESIVDNNTIMEFFKDWENKVGTVFFQEVIKLQNSSEDKINLLVKDMILRTCQIYGFDYLLKTLIGEIKEFNFENRTYYIGFPTFLKKGLGTLKVLFESPLDYKV